MDTSEDTAKLVDMTYKNIIEEFGPCLKQLVVAGKTYLKSLHGMVAAFRNYTDALTKVASLADNSTLKGASDIGAALHHLVEVNKELQAQQSNIMKSLEFDFLEPMEITADKDTKLVGREQKRFQQLHRNRKDDYTKCFSTLKKTRRKKSINSDKQLAQMRMMESTKARLEEFCDDSLKEAITQERILYGTVLERQCALNKQFLIYHTKGCELLQINIPEWEGVAETREVLPINCLPLRNEPSLEDSEGLYYVGSPVDTVIRSPRSYKGLPRERNSLMSRFETSDEEGIYARPMIRAKSVFNLPTNATLSHSKPGTPPSRFSRIVEYSGASMTNRVRAIFPFDATGDHQMNLDPDDIIEYVGDENVTGWQFGDNLASKRSGWFPLSYTEPLTNGSYSPDLNPPRNGSVNARSNYSTANIPKPPPPPATIGSVRANHQAMSEASEYGMPQRVTPRKPLPVEPPMVSSNVLPIYDNHVSTLQSRRHHASQPNIAEAGPNNGTYGKVSRNGPLQSVHL